MNSCSGIRNDLATCLLQTDCVKNGKSGQECLQDHMAELPQDCQHLYKSYVACRRGMLDMRKRFRGNAPTASSANNPPGGISTVGTAVNGTDGSSADSMTGRPMNEQTSSGDPSDGLSPDRAA